MASTPETVTPNQLQQARTALSHQNGAALRTQDEARAWLDGAGLVPYYPHAQFAAAPQGSFAEAILGRPENGWVPSSANSDSGEESFAVEVEDEEPADEVAGPDEEQDEEVNEDEDELDDEDDGDSDEDNSGEEDLSAEASDDEVMLSDDDEFAEDEGDEIAEEDRIDAGGDPVPNDLRESERAVQPPPEPVNGFSPEEKETVSRTLARMIAEGSAVPLNLLGSTTGEPDFVCSAQAFSFVYTLRGDKNWKGEPSQTGSMRVSPLAIKTYGVLKEKGAMAPHELAAEVGQGIVDSAVLRALSELWAIQRVIPVPGPDGAPAKWELLTGRFVRHLKAGANAGQPTALSALLSLYLSQAVAASSDDMETFLSPLAARSRVREVVHGLTASRQLESMVVEGKTLLYMPGALDAMPADNQQRTLPAAAQRSRYEDDDRRAMIEARAARSAAEGGAERTRSGERSSKYPVRKPAGARAEGERSGRPGGPRTRGGFAGRREGGFAPQRRSGSGPRREGGSNDRERRPSVLRDDVRRDLPAASDRPRNEFARPWDGEGGERRASTPRDGERRPFVPREGGERRPFVPRADANRRSFGDRKPYAPREGGERRPFTPRDGAERRPFTPRGDGARPSFGDRKPFTPREGGERRPFTPRDGRPFTPRSEGERRPFTPRSDGERRPFTPREGGERRPFNPREGRPFTPRGDGERRPYTPREGGERRPFTSGGDRPFTPREGSDRPSFTPRGDRPFTPREGGDRKPFGARKPFGGDRGGSGEGRPSSQSGAKSAGPGGAKFGGSGFGRDRKGAPGGFGKPGFSPARRGPGSGPGRGGAPKRRPE